MMATPLTFTFLNPNTPQAVTEALRRILLEKLLSGHPDPAPSPATDSLSQAGREP